jgi:hypothetical protein
MWGFTLIELLTYYSWPLIGNHIFKLLSFFEKIKVGLWDHYAVCWSVYPPYQLLNA